MSDSYNNTQRVSYHEDICPVCERNFPDTEEPPVIVDIFDGYVGRPTKVHDWCVPKPDLSGVTDRKYNRSSDRSALYG